MSTFDPGLEPPGDWQAPYDPPPPGRTGAGPAVALYVWACAGAGLVMSGCCVLRSIGMMFVPTDELMRQVPPDMPNREQIVQMLPSIAVAMAVFGVLLMLIPAVVLAVLGFKVRSGSRGGTRAALVILAVQGAALALIVLVNLIGVAISRSITDLIGTALMAGVLLLIGVTVTKLRAALAQQRALVDPPEGPWGT